MSILSNLFNSLGGTSESSSETVTDRPCANCPSDCAIAGSACSVCEPYKKKLIDAVYYVNNIEEYYARYEVTGTVQASASSGGVKCPYCGATSTDLKVCEYCGSLLTEDTSAAGKIKVSSASEIPNPIMQAQDIIFERYEAVIKKYSAQESSSGGILSQIFSLFSANSSSYDSDGLGAKMSEAEIKEAASLYGVSTGDYLTGLDNGKYLTLKGKKEAASLGNSSSVAPVAVGASGIAGIGAIAGMLLGNSKNTAYNRPQSAPMMNGQRPQGAPPEGGRPGGMRNDNMRPENNGMGPSGMQAGSGRGGAQHGARPQQDPGGAHGQRGGQGGPHGSGGAQRGRK